MSSSPEDLAAEVAALPLPGDIRRIGSSGPHSPGRCSAAVTDRVRKAAFEARVREDFARHNGRDLLVPVVYGYRGDDSVDCYPEQAHEIRVRVTATAEEDLAHWTDGFLDPYWNVDVLSRDPSVDGARSFWIFGPSYELEKPLVAQEGRRDFEVVPRLRDRMKDLLLSLAGLQHGGRTR